MTGHGGDIHAASKSSGIPAGRILDLSASINPLGVPKRAATIIKRHVGELPHYPEPFSGRLAGHIAGRLGVSAGSVICGNGSTELIYLIPRALKPRRALVTAPTFSEYEKACRPAGTGIVRHFLKAEDGFGIDPGGFVAAMDGCDIAFLCNPNNPTGRLMKKEEVLMVAGAARERGCLLVVDEAFIDFCPGESVVEDVAGNPYLVVLRSLTKFYALPGLRVGYGVFPERAADAIMRHKEPWTVNSLAQEAGVAVLDDAEYARVSIKTIKKEKAFLEKGLERMEIGYLPSDANFYMLHVGDAEAARSALLKKGILVRDCSNFAGLDGGYIRVAVRTREENHLLLKELAVLKKARPAARGRHVPAHEEGGVSELERIRAERFAVPEDIERRSFEIISGEADFSGIPGERHPIIKRVIHATADFELGRSLIFHEDAVRTGMEMIRSGRDILTDVEMLHSGINSKLLGRWGGRVICNIRAVDGRPKTKEGETRAERGIESALAENENIGIIAIGNAPTALLKVIELFGRRGYGARPLPLVVGVPVGFVKAFESKALLSSQRYPFITNVSRKGGTPVAAAVVNALIKMAAEGQEPDCI